MIFKKCSIIALCVMLTVSCSQKDEIDPQVQIKEDEFSARISNGCSYPFSGTYYSWQGGSYSLATNQSSDKKYVWRVNCNILPNQRLQYKVKLNTSYPIVIRAIGVKGTFSETYELYDGCYYLNSNGQTQVLDFYSPLNTSGGHIYKAFDFEIIVPNRNQTGQTLTSVPIQITLCSSNGASCTGYPAF